MRRGFLAFRRKPTHQREENRASEWGMAVSAVRRLAFIFTTNASKPRSNVSHTGGTPVPLSLSRKVDGIWRNACATGGVLCFVKV